MPLKDTNAAESESHLADLETTIRIDRNKLDEELEQQAAQFDKIVQGVALAISHRDRAKADLERVEAEEDRNVRTVAARTMVVDSKGGQKPQTLTETAVKSLVVEAETYQDAKALLIRWDYLVVRWNGLKESYSQRHFALKDLTSLWIAGYWRSDGSAGSREPAGSRADNLYSATRNRLADERKSSPRPALGADRERPPRERFGQQ